MAAEFLSEQEYPLWDAFVAQHPLGLIYHLSSWKEALERAFSHIKGHFLVLRDESGKIIAGMPVYVVRSWLLGNRLVSIPYASVSDPLITSAEHYQQLLPEILALRKRTISRSIEIRAVRTIEHLAELSFTASEQFLHHYLPLTDPPEQLRKRFARTAINQMIDRAQKHGLQVQQGREKSDIRLFYDLSIYTRKRLGLPPIPFLFFDSLLRSLGHSQMDILFAMLEEECIAGLLTLKFNNVLHVEYFGGNHQAYQTGASHLLYWEAIRLAWASGCKIMSFGRTDLWNRGLQDFKRRWGTIEEPTSIFRIAAADKRTISKCASVKCSTASRWVFGHAPKPLCKTLATFIYHHHG